MRFWGLIAAVVPACVHAAAPSPPKPVVVAVAKPSASASSSVAPKEIEVRFEQRPIDEKTSELWLLAEGLERRVMEIPARHACVVEGYKVYEHDEAEPRLLCGDDDHRLSSDGNVFFLSKRPMAELRGPPRPVMGWVPRVGASPCPADAVGPTLEILPRVFFFEDTRRARMEVSIPYFGERWLIGEGPEDFWSIRRKLAQTLEVEAESAEHEWSIQIARRGERLVLHERLRGMEEGATEHTWAAYWLPCGARLAPGKASYRDPSWFPTGGECIECWTEKRRCMDPCFDDLTDEQGELTGAGKTCEAHCAKAYDKCKTKCFAQYKH